MKKLLGLFFIGLFVSISVTAQEIYSEETDGLIEGDYDSFKIMDMQKRSQAGSVEAVVIEGEYVQSLLVYNDPNFPTSEIKSAIGHAIKHELINQDYEMAEDKPDLLFTYLVYGKEGRLTGEFSDPNYPGIDEGTDRNNTYEMKKGSLLISAIDVETGETVWSGFSNGAFSGMETIKEEDVIRTVTDILETLTID